MPLLPMGPPQGAGPAGLPLGDPAMMGGAPPGMAPLGLPPTPAEQAGQAALQLVPGQVQAQAALSQQQSAEVLAALMQQLGNAPNPAAEAAQGMPAAQVTPDSGVPPTDTSMTGGGY